MTSVSVQPDSRWLSHRATAHRMRRVNAPIEAIANHLQVSKRSVARYLQLPYPEPAAPAEPESRLEDFYMQGACAAFPELDWLSRSPLMQERCKEVCAGCPVLEQCRKYGLTTGLENTGVWGGLTGPERRRRASQAGQGDENGEDNADRGVA